MLVSCWSSHHGSHSCQEKENALGGGGGGVIHVHLSIDCSSKYKVHLWPVHVGCAGRGMFMQFGHLRQGSIKMHSDLTVKIELYCILFTYLV